ncbi:MAG: hypothetical protein EXQ57_00105 [Bryobacterales bacterium]|nr:hypothetical protein [Bryobacterales bacterium]
MGRLLEQAMTEAAKLPDPEQEALGAWVLAEMEAERRWGKSFSGSMDMLEQMADEAVEEYDRGLTAPLNPDDL